MVVNAEPEVLNEWYYRVGGRPHGPVTRTELCELVESSGETAEIVEVRQAHSNEWVAYSSALMLKCREGEHSGSWPEAVRALAATCSPLRPNGVVGGHPWGSAWNVIRRRPGAFVTGLLFVFLNAVLFSVWPEDQGSERRYRAVLRRCESEVLELRNHEATPSEWSEARARFARELAPMVEDLKLTASASEPCRQHLLWMARDRFPGIVGPTTPMTTKAQALYERQGRLVDAELGEP